MRAFFLFYYKSKFFFVRQIIYRLANFLGICDKRTMIIPTRWSIFIRIRETQIFALNIR